MNTKKVLILLGAVASHSTSTVKANANPGPTKTAVREEYDEVMKLKNIGDVAAVEALSRRLFPTLTDETTPFKFALTKSVNDQCGTVAPPCFSISDDTTDSSRGDGDITAPRISIVGTTASEVSAGLGHYLRKVCNMTIGWSLAGGSNLFVPEGGAWPAVGSTAISRQRNTPWSFFMNVCTLSYSLAWFTWADWEAFIDWMALSGINQYIAYTGQEEVQYQVLQQYGLSDMEIRSWFNGPALLTWSRGQNEYGSNILGPLPRSWMKGQMKLNQQILNRTRRLGMTGLLPGFQGNVPAALKKVLHDKNMTVTKDTAWIDANDPVYTEIVDKWMPAMIDAFGTDHFWLVDGYFNGGTAPWLEMKPNVNWLERGKKVFDGITRHDANAIWSYEGWAFWRQEGVKEAAKIDGFVQAANGGKNFQIIGMPLGDENGQWHYWNEAYFGAKFLAGTLPNFGGNVFMRGNLTRVAEDIPFAALEAKRIHTVGNNTNVAVNVWGQATSPEGIFTNPIYYEIFFDQAFLEEPVSDVSADVVDRALRKYFGMKPPAADVVEHVDRAWRNLLGSVYSFDTPPGLPFDTVNDVTAMTHISWQAQPWAWKNISSSTYEPTKQMCMLYEAWGDLIAVAASTKTINKPMRYDVVNTGREVLAQLSGPIGAEFTRLANSVKKGHNQGAAVRAAGKVYVELIEDNDRLVSTDDGFLLGRYLKMANQLVEEYGTEDCALQPPRSQLWPTILNCSAFYEWNVKTQITTWYPVPDPKTKTTSSFPVNDYASKEWGGLLRDYYAERISRVTTLYADAADQNANVSSSETAAQLSALAYEFTTNGKEYPSEPVGDFLSVSQDLHQKYAGRFTSCASEDY